jgi:hypothetical protein
MAGTPQRHPSLAGMTVHGISVEQAKDAFETISSKAESLNPQRPLGQKHNSYNTYIFFLKLLECLSLFCEPENSRYINVGYFLNAAGKIDSQAWNTKPRA